MGVIKQLKKFNTNVKIYPVTKTNAVYDDTLGRLDNILGNMSTDGLREQIESLEGTTKTLTSTTNTLTTKMSGVETEVDTLNTEMSSVENSVSTLSTKVTSVETDVSAVESGVSALSTQVTNMGTQVDSAENKVESVETQMGALTSEVDTLSTQVDSFSGAINGKADNNVTFTEASTLTNLVSGETISISFGKITKGITDFISHITTKCTASVLGHVILSDDYSYPITNGKAKDGVGVSQYALYSAYNSISTDSKITMKAKGNKTTTTLDFLDIGVWRIYGLTTSNSPSTTDAEGILINASAMNMTTTAMSATFQIFYGKTSNTVYARLQWGDAWTNAWVKLSA